VELKDVRISRNTAHNGGGLAIVGSALNTIRVTAERLVLDRNIASGNGGGMFARYANGTVSGLLVERNHAFNNGGGVWMGRDAVLFNRNGKNRSGFFANVAEQWRRPASMVAPWKCSHESCPIQPHSPTIPRALARRPCHDRPNTSAAFNASGIGLPNCEEADSPPWISARKIPPGIGNPRLASAPSVADRSRTATWRSVRSARTRQQRVAPDTGLDPHQARDRR
jgi:hypothetical protein